MIKHLVEIFVEQHCPPCEEVLSAVEGFSNDTTLEVRVYEREKDFSIFQEREILICPATFVNRRLIFYGAFTSKQLEQYVKQIHPN